jgi:sulfatase modifying factor 1
LKKLTVRILGLILLVGALLGIAFGLLPITQSSTNDVSPSPTITSSVEIPTDTYTVEDTTSRVFELESTLTSIAKTPTLTPIPTDTPKPPPQPPEGMVEIQGGSYLIGSDILGASTKPFPQHQTILETFWIHRYEVTNRSYQTCVEDAVCTPPEKTTSPTRNEYYLNPNFFDYPVIYISYNQALVFCEWIGGTLPSEEQWEAAARGVSGYTYPWGNDAPSQGDASLGISNLLTDTQKVGFYPKDKTPTGIFDMAGNVSEWTSSWLISYPGNLETFDYTDEYRIIKGGNYRIIPELNYTKNYYRRGENPTVQKFVIGFRCVWNPP